MYYLLVGVIAVVLFAALSTTGAFYLGPAFTQATVKAHVTTMINQAQQISAANTLYNADNAKNVGTIAELEEFGYLKEVPAGGVVTTGSWSLDFTGAKDYLKISLAGDTKDRDTVCAIVGKLVGACDASKNVYSYPL